MTIPDEILEHLADRYVHECVDPDWFPFVTWASNEAEKMGLKV